MAVFRYQALDSRRRLHTGELEARSYDEALRRLHSLDYSVRKLEEVAVSAPPAGPSLWKRYRLGAALALFSLGSLWTVASLGGDTPAPAAVPSARPPAPVNLRLTGRVQGAQPVELRISFPELGEGASLSSKDGWFDAPVSVSRRPRRAELLVRAPGCDPARLAVALSGDRIELPALVLQAERRAPQQWLRPAPNLEAQPVPPSAPYPGAVR